MKLKEVIYYSKLLHKQNLVSSTDGNLSVRIGDGFVITPTGVPKRELKVEDLVNLDKNGKPLKNGKPSSEVNLHLEIYKRRKDVNAIVHAHPPFTIALSLIADSLEDFPLSETIITLGKVSIAPFKMPGSLELAKEVADILGEGRAVILKNHGAVTVGSSIKSAYYRMESLEHSSKILFLSKLLGKPSSFTKKQISDLNKISKNYGLK